MNKEALTGEEARMFLRRYKKSLMSRISSEGPTSKFFSKIIVNPTMYDELTTGVVIPKGHVPTFEGIPVEAGADLIYGSIIFLPKFLTVEIGKERKTVVN